MTNAAATAKTTATTTKPCIPRKSKKSETGQPTMKMSPESGGNDKYRDSFASAKSLESPMTVA